jgi:ferrous iron transport protein B
MSNTTIALLGQPNSGKSTLFNGLTGSRQHVGNWPGKTVEQKEGYFTYGGKKYTVIDLPGTYSLSANSEEEIITREYIASGKADQVCILADASQLERTLFMLADYVGIRTPAILLLNMMDVAEEQGKTIDSRAIAKKLGIPVVPFTAVDTKNYAGLFKALEDGRAAPGILDETGISELYEAVIGEPYRQTLALLPGEGIGAYSSAWLAAKLLEHDAAAMVIVKSAMDAETVSRLADMTKGVRNGSLLTGDCKFRWIGRLLEGSVSEARTGERRMGRFDNVATSRAWGKPMAILLILVGLALSMLIAMPFMMASSYLPMLSAPISEALIGIGISAILVSLLCDAVLTAVSFALMMVSFVFGISLVFGFMEEIGYMARISYVFDNTMSKLGLQGKAIMPFLVSLGCNIGGVTGTRVIESWGQRVTTMALSWVVPCASTWAVVGLIGSLFFGDKALIVVLSMFLVAFLHIYITSKIFGRSLIQPSERTGLIMELPPYHKPRYRNLFKFVFNRMGDVLKRALTIIICVSILFWALSYTPDGHIENSLIYKIGIAIEPVTMVFGLRWQMFMAWLSSAMGKEASLGVLAALFNAQGIWTGISGQGVATAALSGSLLSTISKPEALAFLYAFFFNMPCLMALSSTVQESHSLKWSLRIAAYYLIAALLLAMVAYRVGLLIF